MITLARYIAVLFAIALLWWGIGAFVSLEPNLLRWEESSRVAYLIGIVVLMILYWIRADLWE